MGGRGILGDFGGVRRRSWGPWGACPRGCQRCRARVQPKRVALLRKKGRYKVDLRHATRPGEVPHTACRSPHCALPRQPLHLSCQLPSSTTKVCDEFPPRRIFAWQRKDGRERNVGIRISAVGCSSIVNHMGCIIICKMLPWPSTSTVMLYVGSLYTLSVRPIRSVPAHEFPAVLSVLCTVLRHAQSALCTTAGTFFSVAKGTSATANPPRVTLFARPVTEAWRTNNFREAKKIFSGAEKTPTPISSANRQRSQQKRIEISFSRYVALNHISSQKRLCLPSNPSQIGPTTHRIRDAIKARTTMQRRDTKIPTGGHDGRREMPVSLHHWRAL